MYETLNLWNLNLKILVMFAQIHFMYGVENLLSINKLLVFFHMDRVNKCNYQFLKLAIRHKMLQALN